MTNKSIKGRLTALFCGHGREGDATKLFPNLSLVESHEILAHAGLGTDELPVIAHYSARNNWTLVTTDWVFWRQFGKSGAISVSEIMTVGVEMLRTANLTEASELDIMLRGERRVIVNFEPGFPMCGAWNALLFFARRNRRKTV
jgi:hypothetical protein